MQFQTAIFFSPKRERKNSGENYLLLAIFWGAVEEMEKCPGSSCIHCCVWVACIKFNWATNRVLLATVVENLCPFCLCGREISNASRNALLRRVNIANSLKNEVYILQQETIVAWRVGGKLGHQKNIKRLWIRKSCAVWYQKGHDKKNPASSAPWNLVVWFLFFLPLCTFIGNNWLDDVCLVPK